MIYTYWGNKDEKTNGTSILKIASGEVQVGEFGDFTTQEHLYFDAEYVLKPGEVPWTRTDFSWQTEKITHIFGGGGGSGPLTPPGAPTDVMVSPGNMSVLVSWTAPANHGNTPITEYIVTPYIGATAQTPVHTLSTAPNFNVTGLTNGTTYTFVVAAVNEAGTSANSSPSTTVTPQAPASVPAVMPIISRGLPVAAGSDQGGSYAVANAVDGVYANTYRSVFSPNAEVDYINLGGATGGTFSVSFTFHDGIVYTASGIPYNASNSALATALQGAIGPSAQTLPAGAISQVVGGPLPAEVFIEWTHNISTSSPTQNNLTNFNLNTAGLVGATGPTSGRGALYAGPQWFAIDISTVGPSSKTNVWMHFLNGGRAGPGSYNPTASLGTQPISSSAWICVPRNFHIQAHLAPGAPSACPAINDSGWTDLVTPITDNRNADFVIPNLDLHTYNWFRIYITECNGFMGNDDVQFEIDLHNASGGVGDTILCYGASTNSEAFTMLRLDSLAWNSNEPTDGDIRELIPSVTGRAWPPIFTDVSVGGWDAAAADTNKVSYIGSMPHKYLLLCYGVNDANNIDAAISDTSASQAQAYKGHMQSIIDYWVGLRTGNKVIIPYNTYGDINSWTAGNIAIMNQIIDQLLAANPTTTIFGGDYWTTFHDQPQLLIDGLHPSSYGDTGHLWNGRYGFDYFHNLVANGLKTAIYT